MCCGYYSAYVSISCCIRLVALLYLSTALLLNDRTHTFDSAYFIADGDRTPKQKLKVNMTEPHILKFFHDHSKDCKKDLKVKAKAPMTEFLQTVRTTLGDLQKKDEAQRYQLMHMRDILERWKIVGLNRKLQVKPRKFEEYTNEDGEIQERCTEVQLILKWVCI